MPAPIPLAAAHRALLAGRHISPRRRKPVFIRLEDGGMRLSDRHGCLFDYSAPPLPLVPTPGWPDIDLAIWGQVKAHPIAPQPPSPRPILHELLLREGLPLLDIVGIEALCITANFFLEIPDAPTLTQAHLRIQAVGTAGTAPHSYTAELGFLDLAPQAEQIARDIFNPSPDWFRGAFYVIVSLRLPLKGSSRHEFLESLIGSNGAPART